MSFAARPRSIFTTFLLLSAVSSANNAIDESARSLSIEHNRTRLTIRGDLSSAGHERILRQSAALLFSDSDLELDLTIRYGLPPTWSLITDLTLRALARTTSATAEITPRRISIRGVTSNSAAWYSAVGRLEMHLPGEVTLDSAVSSLESRQSFDSICRALFAAALHERKIEFALGSRTLSSSAYGLLDELTELGSDCPNARIRITGNGDGGVNNQETGRLRAEAVISYLEERGFDPARLSAIGAGASTSRRIVFSVRY